MLNIIKQKKKLLYVHKLNAEKVYKLNSRIGIVRQFSGSRKIIKRSEIFAPIHLEDPSDAVVISHKLLIQAGYIRKVYILFHTQY